MRSMDSTSRGHEIPVPIDQLDAVILGSQIASDDRFGPLGAWFLLSAMLVDAVGNVLGVPVFSGLLLNALGSSGAGLTDLRWACRGVVLIHVAALVQGSLLLYATPWRFWMPAIARAGREVWGSKRVVLVVSTLLVIMLVGAVIGISWVRAAAVPSIRQRLIVVPLAFLLLDFGIYGARFVAALAPRLDWPSAIGIMMSFGGAFLSVTLFCANDGRVASFAVMTWNRDDLVVFRIVELTCVAALFGFFAVLASGRDATALYYRAVGPTGAGDEVHYDWAFEKNAVRPAMITLDRGRLPQTVVLRQCKANGFELIDPRERLVPTEDRYVVINLDALQQRLGEGEARLTDQGGFFAGTARFVVEPCPVEALNEADRVTLAKGISERETTLFLNRFLGNKNLRAFLEQALSEALQGYASSLRGSAQDYHDCYMAMFRGSRALVGATLSPLARGGSGGAMRVEGPPMTYLDLDPFLQGQGLIEERFASVHQGWNEPRRKVQLAKQELPRLFRAALRGRLSGELARSRRLDQAADSGLPTSEPGDSALECLLDCVGLTMFVHQFEFAPGAASECQRMATQVDERQASELKAQEDRLLRLDEKMIDRQSEHWMMMRVRLFDLLPKIANRPQLVESLIRSFVRQDGDAPRDFLAQLEQVEQQSAPLDEFPTTPASADDPKVEF